MGKVKFAVLACCLTAWVGVTAAAPIDSFGSPFGSVSTGSASGTTFFTVEALGGYRNLRISSPPQAGSAELSTAAPGELIFLGSGCDFCAGTVRWDANGTGLNGVSLAGPDNAFALRLLGASEAVDVSVTIVDKLFHAARLIKTVNAYNGIDPQIVNFLYDDFVELQSEDTLFSQVNEISLRISARGERASPLVRLDSIETFFVQPPVTPPPPQPPTPPGPNVVPTPGTLALTGVGFLAALVTRRRWTARVG